MNGGGYERVTHYAEVNEHVMFMTVLATWLCGA
jgi:hypothetical protein